MAVIMRLERAALPKLNSACWDLRKAAREQQPKQVSQN